MSLSLIFAHSIVLYALNNQRKKESSSERGILDIEVDVSLSVVSSGNVDDRSKIKRSTPMRRMQEAQDTMLVWIR